MYPAVSFSWNSIGYHSPARGFFLLNMITMKNEIDLSRSKLTPEIAYRMLREEGLEVTLEQAAEILVFLRKLANIAVSNYIKKRK